MNSNSPLVDKRVKSAHFMWHVLVLHYCRVLGLLEAEQDSSYMWSQRKGLYQFRYVKTWNTAQVLQNTKEYKTCPVQIAPVFLNGVN